MVLQKRGISTLTLPAVLYLAYGAICPKTLLRGVVILGSALLSVSGRIF